MNDYARALKGIEQYLQEPGMRPEFIAFWEESLPWFCKERAPRHPGIQNYPGGRVIHTFQVLRMADHLTPDHYRDELYECCLVHDIRGCEKLPLTEAQRLAIAATKGLPYEKWRPTPHFRFVALVLIADMWSAFVNKLNNVPDFTGMIHTSFPNEEEWKEIYEEQAKENPEII